MSAKYGIRLFVNPPCKETLHLHGAASEMIICQGIGWPHRDNVLINGRSSAHHLYFDVGQLQLVYKLVIYRIICGT